MAVISTSSNHRVWEPFQVSTKISSPSTWLRGPGPPAALEGAWYQAASFRGGRGRLRAHDGHRGESAASFTWLHDRHGVNIFVSASYVGTGCRRAGPPPKAWPAQAAVDSATEAPESGWFLAYSSSLGRRVIGEIIPESCIHLCEEPVSKGAERLSVIALHPQMKTWNGSGVTCTRWHMWPCQPSAVAIRSTERRVNAVLRLLPDHGQEALEDRAAIREHDGGLDSAVGDLIQLRRP